jgi:hypothetical protein
LVAALVAADAGAYLYASRANVPTKVIRCAVIQIKAHPSSVRFNA